MHALHTAATGMMAQEMNVQVISNNIANLRTTGYKRQRIQFQEPPTREPSCRRGSRSARASRRARPRA
jgi:flagellar basal body rod protein FlgG